LLYSKKEFYYILGFLYGDGGTNSSNAIIVQNSIKDSDIINKISSVLNIESRLGVSRIKEKEYKTIGFYIGKEKASAFINAGIRHRKTYERTSSTFEGIPYTYKKDFIRGYFDADGTIGLSNQYTFSIVSLNLELLRAISSYFQEAINYEIAIRKDKQYFRLTAKGNYIVGRIRDEIYYKNCLCLERKRQQIFECITKNTSYKVVLPHKYVGVTFHSDIGKWIVRYKNKHISVAKTEDEGYRILTNHKENLP
jgi:hypothetical protein